MNTGKKFIALFLAVVITIGAMPTAFAGNNTYQDVPATHWASEVIAKWSGDNYNILLGDGKGNFNPDKGITLGELATILSKTFGYIERTEVEVTPNWADEYVEKAIAAGVIDKADKIDAGITITREQAIKYIARAYNVPPVDGDTTFVDDADISAEYKPYVKAFQQLGYVIGDNIDPSKSKFNPKGYYTRAAAIQVLDNATSDILDKSVKGAIYDKTVIIRKQGVEIQDTTVKGNLIIGQGVGDGKVTLDKVYIGGILIVYGGGSNSIEVKGDNIIQSTIVNKPFGEAVHLNGTFGTITVSNGTKVIITGKVEKLIILDANAHVTLENASISSVEILGNNVELAVNSGSTADNVIINANKAVISGNGKVSNVQVNEKAKEGVEVLTIPTKVTVDALAGTVKTKYIDVKPGSTVITSYPSSGGGGGGGGGGGSYSPAKYTVTFDLNYDNSPSFITMSVESGMSIEKPTDPVREGYIFSGWYKEKECLNAFTFGVDQIFSDTILYAKWESSHIISLSVSDDTLIIDEDSNILYFYLSTQNTTADSITLYEQSIAVAELYDDGDYDLHGDDMAGDGIYSAIYKITTTEDAILMFHAEYEGEQSNILEVKVYSPITEEVLENMEMVDSGLEEVLGSDEFPSATEEERKQLIEEALEELSQEGLIKADSILYDEETGFFSFQYEGGILGGVMTKDFDKDYNSSERYTSNEDNLPGPLNQEEEQQLRDTRSGLQDTYYNTFATNEEELPEEQPTDEVGTAIILNAFPAFETDPYNIEFRTEFYDNLKDEWDAKGLKTTLDTDVTVDDFKKLGNYDIICISTHGSTYVWYDGFNRYQCPAICLAEQSTSIKDKQYSAELKAKRIVKVTLDIGTCYWLLPEFIDNAYNADELDGAFVFLETCNAMGEKGNVDYSMANAYLDNSAETVVGFHNSVYAVYCREFMKTYVDQLIEGETTKTAFDIAISENGENHKVWYEAYFDKPYDPQIPIAYPILKGSENARLYHIGIKNGDFSSMTDILYGYPSSWKIEGDVRSIAKLGEIETQGLYNLRMAIITTGIGSKTTAVIGEGTEGSMMYQTFVVPEFATSISFEYDFVSEEPMEWVGTKYNDAFVVQLKHKTSVVFEELYESINTSEWISVKGVDFAGGDDTAYHTGWKSATIDVSAYRGKMITLCFIIYDVGDKIYDSACLIDNVKID